MSALTKAQKRFLSQLAREAWERTEEPRPDVNEWRHEEVARACGKVGLRCCTQQDYAAVKGHFLGLLGRDGKAFLALVHGEGNEKRQAEFKLAAELRKAGLPPQYAESICKNQFKCYIADASAKQVWKVFFTVRSRAAARRRKTKD